MSIETAELCTAFAKHVLASGRLPELKALTKKVDNTVEESHTLLKEIKALYSSVNNKSEEREEICDNKDDIARHEEISKFLASGPPRFLLPDMESMYDLELDVEKTIAKTIAILEKLRSKEITFPSTRTKNNFNFSSDFTDYAHSLEQFGSRLTHISTIECNRDFQRDLGLECKLQSLSNDVEQLWKMIQAKMKIAQIQEKVPQKVLIEDSAALLHVESINKLIGTINEITFLLQNSNH